VKVQKWVVLRVALKDSRLVVAMDFSMAVMRDRTMALRMVDTMV
jgi:hypothetical protein